MSQLKLLMLTVMCSSVFYFSSCEDDRPANLNQCDGINASYNSAVKSIIDNTCAYVGCHDGTGDNPNIFTANVDFTNFEGIVSAINNGSITRTVLTDKTMPPSLSLTNEQIQILTCWKDAGFPEN